MADSYRKLKDDFRGFMGAKDALRMTADRFNEVLFDHGMKGLRTGVFNDWKKGKYVAQSYHERIIGLVISATQFGDCLRMQRALFEYLETHGVGVRPPPSVETILPIICSDPMTTPGDDYDYFLEGLGIVRRLSDWPGKPEDCCDPCPENEIENASRWMYVTVGRDLLDDPGCGVEAAEEAATRRICIGHKEYAKRALAWREKFPWAVVAVRGEHGYVGMSIVLPVSESAYYAVREGQLPSYDIPAGELKAPSDHLIIEGVGTRPVELGGTKRNVTLSAVAAIIVQASTLSSLATLARDESSARRRIHALSFAGTPRNRKRLMKHGYRPTGTYMRDTGVEFMERVFGYRKMKLEGLFFALTFKIACFVPLLRGEPSPRRTK